MSNVKNILEKIEAGNASWNDYSDLLKKDIELELLFKHAHTIRTQNFGNYLKIYIPDKRFPAISITGNSCALECEHCDKHYLENMKPITEPKDLENFLLKHASNNGVGVLLSGGCEVDGSVPLIEYLDVVKNVKNKTDLVINTHTGLLNEETAQKLADAKVDIVSFDINMDEEVVQHIYHLNKNLSDYRKAVEILKKYNLNIVPHVCIGLHYGNLNKEIESIKFIKENIKNPSLIVLIALIPPKDQEDKRVKFSNPDPKDIAKVISIIRLIFPKTEISLGCMRPRGNLKFEIEKYAILAGVNRIEIPSTQTLSWAKEQFPNLSFKFFSACCAIPEKYEKFSKSFDKDIKRYLKI